MAKPSGAVREHLLCELKRTGLMGELPSDALFSPLNWHQSLSDRFEDDPVLIEKLLSVLPRISARSPRFRIDRIESQAGPGTIHWAFMPAGKPADFAQLLGSIRAAISSVDDRRQISNSAHLTISYRAPRRLRMVEIEPIEWIVDEVLLVRGGGAPYQYEVLGSQSLEAPGPNLVAEQLDLF